MTHPLPFHTRTKHFALIVIVLSSIVSAPLSIKAADTFTRSTADEQKCLQAAGIDAKITEVRSADRETLLKHCADYLYLLDKFDLGEDSKKGGLTKEKAIFGLNPEFAGRVAKFLRSADAEGKNIRLNSACRTTKAQQSANPKVKRSRHMFGVAVDLNWGGGSRDDCRSNTYHWVRQNLPKAGLIIAVPTPPECNHVEALNNNGQRAGPPGGDPTECGVGGNGNLEAFNGAPSSEASQALREMMGGAGGQMSAQQQQTTSQQQAIQCAMQGGSWYTLNSMTGQGICQPGTNQPPQAPTSPQMPSTPQTSGSGTGGGTAGSTGSTGGSTNTTGGGSTTTADPVLACTKEASDPVCGKQTTCPSVVSPNGTCTVGAKKTYLNTCLLNVDKATLISQGKCPQTTQDELDTLAQPNTPKKETKPITTVTLVEDPAATVGELKDQSTNAFTAAPRPGTPSYEQQRLTSQQPVSQQTFSDPSVAVIPGSSVLGQSTNTTFVETALANIVSALSRLQQLLTPMRYTITQYNEDGSGEETYTDIPEIIDEEGIQIYVEE